MRTLAITPKPLFSPMLQQLLPHRIPKLNLNCSFQWKTASLQSLPFCSYNSKLFPNRNSPSITESPTRHLSPYFHSSTGRSSATFDDGDFDIELNRLLVLLPEEMRRKVSEHLEIHHLIEIVMDLGRNPLARFPSGDFILSHLPITFQDLEHAMSRRGAWRE